MKFGLRLSYNAVCKPSFLSGCPTAQLLNLWALHSFLQTVCSSTFSDHRLPSIPLFLRLTSHRPQLSEQFYL